MMTLLVLLVMANLSCQYQGSHDAARRTPAATPTPASTEVASTEQPAPAEQAVVLASSTPARVLTATGQAVFEGDGVNVTVPTSLTLGCGWIGEIPVKIENSTPAAHELILYARPPVNVFVNGRTIRPGQEDGAIEVWRTTVAPGENREVALELQSLRVGRLSVPLACLGQEASLHLNSQVVERGAYFMYRCWFEGSDFFKPIWSNGAQKIDAAQRKAKINETGRRLMRSGMTRDQAEREAKRTLLDEFRPAAYELVPNWQALYNQKKDRHPETYGFQFVDIDGLGWNQVEIARGQYDWTVADFMLKLWTDQFGAAPFVRIEAPPEWTRLERGLSGNFGFYDTQNVDLLEQWEKYCETLAERYDGDGENDAPGSVIITHFILPNEPEGWLNVDFDRDGWPREKPAIWDTDWWIAGTATFGAKSYAQKCGDFLYAVTARAADGIHRANPSARIATPQFAAIGEPTNEMFDYLLAKGVATKVDAWGIHPANALFLLWQTDPAAIGWLDDATNQAPPFSAADLNAVRGALNRRGQTLSTLQPIDIVRRENPYMGKLWRKLIDQSFSQSLEDLNKLLAKYKADLPIWVTEQLTIGPLATNRRENLIAALRGYAIVFHQKVETTVLAGYIGANTRSADVAVDYLPDPSARDLIVDIGRAIGGASPVTKFDSQWFQPGERDYLDYRWTVYKLFNRGDEDIIAIWSNSAKDEILDFELQPGAQISKIRQIKYDAGESQFKKIEPMSAIPAHLTVKPLQQFYFISVTSDQPKFGWLKKLQRRLGVNEAELISQYHNTAKAVENAKRSLRGRGREDASRYRSIPRMLGEAEDALIMGNFGLARQNLDEINQMISRL